MLLFKTARLEQIHLIASFARMVWTEHYSPIIGPEQVEYMLSKYQSSEQIKSDLLSGYIYDLAWEDGNLAAYCAYRLDNDSVFLSKLYVKREKRGRKIATHFLERLKECARQKQKYSIILTVNKRNPSLAVYTKMGFTIIDDVVIDIGAGFFMDDYLMELKFV